MRMRDEENVGGADRRQRRAIGLHALLNPGAGRERTSGWTCRSQASRSSPQ